MKKQLFYIASILLFVTTYVQAQDELPRRYESYSWSSESQPLSTKSDISHTVSIDGAIWLRLYFQDVVLPKGSHVVITSKLDGATQILDETAMKLWNNSSAYFNGNEVSVQVESNDRSAGVAIYELEIGELDLGPTTRSQCGSVDNRTDSNNPAIGRIVPIGCTGWIIRNGKLVTAGHCVSSRAQVLEFNVPQSNSNGSIVHPPIASQFPIIQSSFITQYVRGNPDTDWAVFETSTNSQGLSAIAAQGSSYNVVQSSPGSSITITGFGVDTGSDNQTQQTHTGPLDRFTGTRVYYQTDTEGGNSGSPIIETSTGNAVGVHAYGGCSTNGSGANFGARATISPFWDAMDLDGSNPPDGDCIEVDFNDFTISSFANQDAAGNYQIQGGGTTLYMEDNTWKSISVSYTITPSTIITFEFGSTSEGEIHGIALENNNTLTSSRVFKVHGTQNYGVTNYDNYSGSSYRSYSIPVGSFYTGDINRIVFINDNDAGADNTSFFRNVKVIDPSSCTSLAVNLASNARTANNILPIYGVEEEVNGPEIQLFPNPVHDFMTITAIGIGEASKATLTSLSGQRIVHFELQNGPNRFQLSNLPTGVYILKVGQGSSVVNKKVIIK
ncbi:MAG: T9SS type A sorting domain-containing protein [Bacteroidota bacterium]